jgi:hypothetical protein
MENAIIGPKSFRTKKIAEASWFPANFLGGLHAFARFGGPTALIFFLLGESAAQTFHFFLVVMLLSFSLSNSSLSSEPELLLEPGGNPPLQPSLWLRQGA